MSALDISLGIGFVVVWVVCIVVETERERLACRVVLLTNPGTWMRAYEVAERARFAGVNTAYDALRALVEKGFAEEQEVPGGPERSGRPAYVYRARP